MFSPNPSLQTWNRSLMFPQDDTHSSAFAFPALQLGLWQLTPGWLSLKAQWLRRVSQGHEMFCIRSTGHRFSLSPVGSNLGNVILQSDLNQKYHLSAISAMLLCLLQEGYVFTCICLSVCLLVFHATTSITSIFFSSNCYEESTILVSVQSNYPLQPKTSLAVLEELFLIYSLFINHPSSFVIPALLLWLWTIHTGLHLIHQHCLQMFLSIIPPNPPALTLKMLNFWKFTSYCSLKPLWSGMGEVVPACTSPTLHPPSPPTVHQLSWLAL